MTDSTTTQTAAGLLGADHAAAAGAAAGAPPPAGGGTGAATAPDWLKDADPETQTWVSSKGFKTPADALASHRNLEKLLGSGEKLLKPKGDDDVEGFNQLYKALGRPEKPEEYKLPVPEGQDGAFAKEFAPVLHKLGLSQRQAAGLAEAWNARTAKAIEDDTRARAQQAEVDMGELRKEWGGQYDANVEAGRRAARQFGISGEDLTKIESGLGTGGLLRLMSKLGSALAEDPGVPGEGKSTFGTTKDQASAEIDSLKLDKNFQDAYLNSSHAGHKAAVEKMERLHKIKFA